MGGGDDESDSDSQSTGMDCGSVKRSLEVLCQDLNMDEDTSMEALEVFTKMFNTYTLEVNINYLLSIIIVLLSGCSVSRSEENMDEETRGSSG